MTIQEVSRIVNKERNLVAQVKGFDKRYQNDMVYEAINHGDCYIAADMIYKEIIRNLSPKDPIIHSIQKIDTPMFTNNGFIKTGTMFLNNDFPQLQIDIESFMMPPELYSIITYQELIDMHMCLGTHCFVLFDGMLYDSECPNGVKYAFDLPFFKRILDVYIRMRNRPNSKLTVIPGNGSGDDRFFIDDKEITPEEADSYRGTIINYCNKAGEPSQYMLKCINNYSQYSRALGGLNIYASVFVNEDQMNQYTNGEISEYYGCDNCEDEYDDRAIFSDIDLPGLPGCHLAYYLDEFNEEDPIPSFSIEYRGIKLCRICLVSPDYISLADGFYGLNHEQKVYLNTFLRSKAQHPYYDGMSLWEFICENINRIWQNICEEPDDSKLPSIPYNTMSQPDYRLL